MMSCSATAMSSSSNLCSGFSTAFAALPVFGVAAALTTRAISASPFQLSDGAGELPGFRFEPCHPRRIPTPFCFRKLADYPTVPTLHVVEPDSLRQLLGHIVVHTRRWRRPRPSDQVLFLWRVFRQLCLEPGGSAALVGLQHPDVHTAVSFVQLVGGELCSHPLERDRPDRKQLQQISAYGEFLPRQPGGQTVRRGVFRPVPAWF